MGKAREKVCEIGIYNCAAAVKSLNYDEHFFVALYVGYSLKNDLLKQKTLFFWKLSKVKRKLGSRRRVSV